MRQIKPINNNGSIQLKFSFAGKRYSFNPIPGASFDKAKDIAQVNAIATKIQNDILAGYFDSSLDRYRLAHKASAKTVTSATKPTLLLELWDLWVDSLQLAPATKADHYEMVRRMIAKTSPKLDDTKWLTDAAIAPATFNKRLGYLKSCYS